VWKVIAIVEFVLLLGLVLYIFWPFKPYTMEDALQDEIKARKFDVRVKKAARDMREYEKRELRKGSIP
jgi:hypothetical protein